VYAEPYALLDRIRHVLLLSNTPRVPEPTQETLAGAAPQEQP
jgi:rod shape-determining protein MreC